MHRAFSHVRTYVRWYALVFLVASTLCLSWISIRENRHGQLTVAFLDVGQGDGIFIDSPTGTQVLIDGGPDANLLRALPHVLPWYDRHIDLVVVTNPDKDHYEGFIPLLSRYSVDAVLEPGTVSKTPTYATLEKEITDHRIPKIIARRGQVIDIGGGAYIEILFPDRDASGLSSNDGSIVARLVYGDTSVALQGDSTARIEHYLVSLDGSTLHSTILKTGHHGSRTSSTEEYVRAVSPQYAVISAGRDNSYGHPHKETLDTLNALKIPILGTYVLGDIIFKSDGKEMKLVK